MIKLTLSINSLVADMLVVPAVDAEAYHHDFIVDHDPAFLYFRDVQRKRDGEAESGWLGDSDIDSLPSW